MGRIDERFAQLKKEGRTAMIPFIAAGDPDLEFTSELILALADHGADLIEIGFPYSDPIADGPVIQASYSRALDRKMKVADLFAQVKKVSGQVKVPLVAMVSFATVLKHEIGTFTQRASDAGFSGMIVPDLPFDEASSLRDACNSRSLSLVQLVTPTTGPQRSGEIASFASGFIYYVSITGITGVRAELPADLSENVEWLRKQTRLPVCIGFGISRPEHVRMLAPHADGLIVGSALVRHLENYETLGRASTFAAILQQFDELRDSLSPQRHV